MEIKIRDLDPVVVKKIDELAKKKRMSRNEYLKQHLSGFAMTDEMEKLENKYTDLVNKLSELVQQSNDALLFNNQILEETIKHK